jgi:carbonic anhydrase
VSDATAPLGAPQGSAQGSPEGSAQGSARGAFPAGAFPVGAFDDVLGANAEYAATFHELGLTGRAARGLAVVTCMDSRIDPLRVLGMGPGDVKILRNAGARVTEDVLRTLVLATYLLGVDRVLVMPHTKCKMASGTEEEIHDLIETEYGVDTRSMEFRTTLDQQRALATDLRRIRSFPLLPEHVVVGGAMYDVDTGLLSPIDA